ncbi:carbohydrate deacetylase [Aliivibrio sifiae]|uniref:Carbohydrate deacetylase n=1 Tax=Aliivibrio sifiae TaxID=566293 RepID=A0A2S7XJ55_9GAMM|nr:carbohydrate deacetylase [Aliivibrio sifiae]PQJ93431.1 carbohydrate deacetylase [Aliivibrio sifiae]GLR74483.1 carbohydrate deacetylase [Aliivibrio sifiae]
MKLIMNADDFGLSESVNNGIVECLKSCIVKSTTIMMNQKGVDHAALLYKEGLVPEVGLHFTVTAGQPLSNPLTVSSLVDEHGYFLDRKILMTKNVSDEEVYIELKAQYNAAIKAGFDINHIDSHHFAGVYPPLKKAFIRFANETGLPVRRIDNIISGQDGLIVPTPDAFDAQFFDEGVSLKQLQTLLLGYKETLSNGVLELMCHPSTEDNSDLTKLTSYKAMRVVERDLLTSPELSLWLKKEGIVCIGFNDLSN